MEIHRDSVEHEGYRAFVKDNKITGLCEQIRFTQYGSNNGKPVEIAQVIQATSGVMGDESYPIEETLFKSVNDLDHPLLISDLKKDGGQVVLAASGRKKLDDLARQNTTKQP